MYPYLPLLLILAVAVFLTSDATEAEIPFVLVIVVSGVLAVISGAFGVAKRRAALQSAGDKTPKSG